MRALCAILAAAVLTVATNAAAQSLDVVAWNVESGGAKASVIADSIEAMQGVRTCDGGPA